ncbi:MAG: ATP-binding cassette domain-containing protein, partial [Burkholderiaceae bacterium]
MTTATVASAAQQPVAAGTPLVAMHGVSVVFGGGVRALDDVSLEIASGEIVGLVGESGSGKTTLCRVLVGLTQASGGTVEVDG